MERRELIFMDAKSSKFWNIELDGSSHTVTYGRIGTGGQSKTKEFASNDKAKSDFDKLVASKISKGYIDAASERDANSGGGSDELPFAAFGLINKQNDVYENVKTFAGKKVVDYDPSNQAARGGKTIYRFRSDWEEDHLEEYLRHFCESDAATEATGIVIGNWGGEDSQRKSDFVVELLVEHCQRLPNLEGARVRIQLVFAAEIITQSEPAAGGLWPR